MGYFMKLWQWLKAWSSPRVFYWRSGKWYGVLWPLAWLLLGIGLIGGLFIAPSDVQQGETFRILYVHVPCAFFSMALYVALVISSVGSWVFRIKVADALAQGCARWGAVLTALALLTGALWGKPMWGTGWVWDARLTSELILLFLYLGYLGLRQAFSDGQQAMRASALLAIIGGVDLPIIHYSVKWWHTLHQGPTLLKVHPAIDFSMLWPLLFWLAGFLCYAMAWVLMYARATVLIQHRHHKWVGELV